jgi:hypothetical protein
VRADDTAVLAALADSPWERLLAQANAPEIELEAYDLISVEDSDTADSTQDPDDAEVSLVFARIQEDGPFDLAEAVEKAETIPRVRVVRVGTDLTWSLS